VAAEDDVDVARIAEDALAARLTEAELRERVAKGNVEVAVSRVAKAAPETAKVLSEVDRLQRDLAALAPALRFLARIGALDTGKPGSPHYTGQTAADLALGRLTVPINDWRIATESREPAFRAWLAALATNADATLAP
jgi:hypothetical protein